VRRLELSEAAFDMDDDWGNTRLARHDNRNATRRIGRPPLQALNLDEEVIDLRRNWVLGKEKDTKTHQNRRIALDTERS